MRIYPLDRPLQQCALCGARFFLHSFFARKIQLKIRSFALIFILPYAQLRVFKPQASLLVISPTERISQDHTCDPSTSVSRLSFICLHGPCGDKLIERNPPPRGVSYLLCSLIKNRQRNPLQEFVPGALRGSLAILDEGT